MYFVSLKQESHGIAKEILMCHKNMHMEISRKIDIGNHSKENCHIAFHQLFPFQKSHDAVFTKAMPS